MFDSPFPEIADLCAVDDAALIDAVGEWSRAENAACARKVALMAELLIRRTGADTAEERDSWFVDPVGAVGAEIGAAQNITQGLALAQAHRGIALRDRLPRVARLFADGLISELLVRTFIDRAALVTDPEALAEVDSRLADEVITWGPKSAAKTQNAVDAIVDSVDPGALRRQHDVGRSRNVSFGDLGDEAGFTSLWARLYAPDAVALRRRLDEMADTVCELDPRTGGERRADALGALAAGQEVLACECGNDDCAAAGSPRGSRPTAVLHIVGDAAALAIATNGAPDPAPAPPGTPSPASNPEAPEGFPPSDRDHATPASTPAPADAPLALRPRVYVLGGGVMSPELLTRFLDRAKIRELRLPGQDPPEKGYVPSQSLSDFVRCRDLTCRFPGCDHPADRCDIDHTVPYPLGCTHASNLKCLCRFHHLLKTFWIGHDGWTDKQSPDGTVIWTAPTGHTYTTTPGSRLLFPTLTVPTGELLLPDDTAALAEVTDRAAMMPKRRRTRSQNTARRIAAERELNDPHVAGRNEPPPF